MRFAFGSEHGAGRTLISNFMAAKYGGIVLRFKAPIYEISHQVREKCEIRQHANNDLMRCVYLWGCSQSPNVWIDLMEKKIDQLHEDDNVYIPDLISEQQFCFLQDKGFTMVKLLRNRRFDETTFSIPFENNIRQIPNDEWDYILPNNDSKGRLEREIEKVVRNDFPFGN